MNSTTRLAQDQQTLLRAVLSGHCDNALSARVGSNPLDASNPSGAAEESLARRGLRAYQSHGLALAERALGAAFPVIAQLMGEENFTALAQHFWRQQPPTCGDMARWGERLANFLSAAPQLAAEPYLADVARVEWALHRASFAADASSDLASFACLSAEPPAMPSLKLSPGVWLLASAFPVASLIDAHRLPPANRQPALADAAALLAGCIGENVLVWREGFRALVKCIGAAEQALLAALLAGDSLDAALTKASRAEERYYQPTFDFTEWLTNAVKIGLVTGASLISNDVIHNYKGASA